MKKSEEEGDIKERKRDGRGGGVREKNIYEEWYREEKNLLRIKNKGKSEGNIF